MSDTHAGMPAAKRREPPKRIRIRPLEPVVDAGRYPPKRCVGDTVTVAADVFGDGHEKLRAVVRYKPPTGARWCETPMEPIGNDRWHGSFTATELGRWKYTVTAWIDRWASWQWELKRKLEGGQKDLTSELLEGAALAGVDSLTVEEALDPATAPKQERRGETAIMPLELIVDREGGRF